MTEAQTIELSDPVDKPEKDGKIYRVILDLNASAAEELDELKEAFNLNKRTDVVRLALGVLRIYGEQKREGGELLIKARSGDMTRIVIPQQF